MLLLFECRWSYSLQILLHVRNNNNNKSNNFIAKFDDFFF